MPPTFLSFASWIGKDSVPFELQDSQLDRRGLFNLWARVTVPDKFQGTDSPRRNWIETRGYSTGPLRARVKKCTRAVERDGGKTGDGRWWLFAFEATAGWIIVFARAFSFYVRCRNRAFDSFLINPFVGFRP